MWAALASADAVTWLSIAVKALAYAATLSAVGAVLALALLSGLDRAGQAVLRRTALLSALLAALFTALRLPLRASFLMGGTLDGAFDGMILGMVAQSPLGTSAALRLVGLALICTVLWRGWAGMALALLGALLAAASFALRGHALGGAPVILGALVTLHMLCLAFWVGAFAPLARAARVGTPAQAGALAQSFGAYALWAVGLLVAAGAALLVLLDAARASVLTTAYGQFFAIKLTLFAAVMALAALNKLSLTPALLAGEAHAARRLRRSIKLEATLITAILITTATLTALSSPT